MSCRRGSGFFPIIPTGFYSFGFSPNLKESLYWQWLVVLCCWCILCWVLCIRMDFVLYLHRVKEPELTQPRTSPCCRHCCNSGNPGSQSWLPSWQHGFWEFICLFHIQTFVSSHCISPSKLRFIKPEPINPMSKGTSEWAQHYEGLPPLFLSAPRCYVAILWRFSQREVEKCMYCRLSQQWSPPAATQELCCIMGFMGWWMAGLWQPCRGGCAVGTACLPGRQKLLFCLSGLSREGSLLFCTRQGTPLKRR